MRFPGGEGARGIQQVSKLSTTIARRRGSVNKSFDGNDLQYQSAPNTGEDNGDIGNA
jgi:hypothetical protein